MSQPVSNGKIRATIRKVMRAGNSLVVSLPREYRTTHGIKPGDDLRLIFDGALIIKPIQQSDLESEMAESLEALRGPKHMKEEVE